MKYYKEFNKPKFSIKGEVVDALIILILSIFVFHKILGPGYLIRLDLEFPFDLKQTVNRFFYVWDPWVNMGLGSLSYGDFTWWIIALPAFLGINEAVIGKVVHILILAMAGWSSYYLCHYLTKGKRLPSLIGSFVYMFNPWVLDRIVWGHFTIYFGYALPPLALVFFIKSLDSLKTRDFIIAAFVLGIQLWVDLYLSYILLLGMSIYSFVCLFSKIKKEGLTQELIKRMVIGVICMSLIPLVMHALWLLPAAYKVPSETYFGSGERMWVEDLYGYSYQSTFQNIIRLRYFRFSYFKDMEAKLIEKPTFYSLTFLMPVLAFTTILFTKKNEYVKPFFVLLVFFLVLSSGTNLPFKIYEWMWFRVPGIAIFRDVNAWIYFVALCYSALYSIMSSSVIEKIENTFVTRSWEKKRFTLSSMLIIIFIGIVFISILVNSWPMFTGNFYNKLKSFQVPKEYKEMSNWFKQQKDDFRVLIIPYHFGIWSVWADEHIHNPLYISPPKPIVIGGRAVPTSMPFLDFLQNVVRAREISSSINLGKILSIFNIKYISVNGDIDISHTPWFQDLQPAEEVNKFLSSRKELSLAKKDGYLSAYTNNYFTSLFTGSYDNAIVVGSRDLVLSMSNINNFNFNKLSMIFADQLNKEKLKEKIERSDYMIFHEKNIDDLIFLNVDDKYEIIPANYAGKFSDSNKNWVRKFFFPLISDINFMGEYYNSDIILATGDQVMINVPFNIENTQNYEIWIRTARGPEEGELSIKIDNKEISRFQLYANSFVGFKWIRINEKKIGSGDHKLTLTKIGSYGEVIIDRIVIIPPEELKLKKEESMNFLNNKKIVLSYNKELSFTKPGWIIGSTNKWPEKWKFDGIGFTRNYSFSVDNNIANTTYEGTNNTYGYFWTKTKIAVSDYPYLIVRVKGTSNAEFKIFLNGKDWKYQWVNVPDNWVKSPENFTTYIFKMPAGIYGETIEQIALVTKSVDENPAINYWEYLILSKKKEISFGITESEIFIPKDGYYTIAIQTLTGSKTGKISIGIDNKKYDFNTTTLGSSEYKYIYVGPLFLDKNHHKFTIESDGNDLTEVTHIFIYNDNNEKSSTLEEIFPTSVESPEINYKKTNPTKYIVSVLTDKPFTLTFRESFSPEWVATSNGKVFDHFLTYSSLNGYLIDKTGNFDIIIEYKQQKYRYVGFLISGIATVCLIMYIFYPEFPNLVKKKVKSFFSHKFYD